jgi:transcriptional regulator with XRE-family HTH domain
MNGEMTVYYASQFRKLRRERGLTQRQVAGFLHLERSTYAYYESGRTKANIDILVQLARFYQVGLDSFLGEHLPEAAPGDGMGASGNAGTEPINESVTLFSQLSREEQRLVILYRSAASAQREALLAQAAAQAKPA